MSPISDDSFPEWNLFGAGKLMKLQWIRPDWPACLLRARSFQKANLPCIIMSICDLGQAFFNALVLLETLAEEERHHPLFWSLCCSSSQPLELSHTLTAGYLQLSLPAHCSSIAVEQLHAETGRSCWRRRAAQSCVPAHKLITSEMLQTLTAGGEVAPRVCVRVCVSVFVCMCEDEKQSAGGMIMHNGGRNL